MRMKSNNKISLSFLDTITIYLGANEMIGMTIVREKIKIPIILDDEELN